MASQHPRAATGDLNSLHDAEPDAHASPGPSGPAAVGRQWPLYLGRSLLPGVALVIILGTIWWGPWVTLGLTAAYWILVTRIG
jgi:hypothetical protein